MKELLARITAALDAANIPYMVTGSFACTLLGSVRTTLDIDIVIDPTPGKLRRFVRSLSSPEYYVDLNTAVEALERRTQFNVIDFESALKVDLIIRKDTPSNNVAFERRQPADIEGTTVYVTSPEDIVLAKMAWSKQGGSARQIEDVAGVLKVHGEMDFEYIRYWVRELELEPQWHAACEAAGIDPQTGRKDTTD